MSAPTGDPMECKKCGKPHGPCSGHNRAQNPCENGTKGKPVCHIHGGKAPQVIAKAKDRQMRVGIGLLAKALAGTDYVPPEPEAIILERITDEAMTVEGLRRMKDDAEKIVQKTDDGDKPAAIFDMWQKLSAQLFDHCKEAIKLGFAEREVRMAEAAGIRIIDVFELALNNPRWGLTVAQKQLGRESIGEAVRTQMAA